MVLANQRVVELLKVSIIMKYLDNNTIVPFDSGMQKSGDKKIRTDTRQSEQG